MKRPYFNQVQRQIVRLKTTQGAFWEFDIAWQKLIREISKTWFGKLVIFIKNRPILYFSLMILFWLFIIYDIYLTIANQ